VKTVIHNTILLDIFKTTDNELTLTVEESNRVLTYFSDKYDISESNCLANQFLDAADLDLLKSLDIQVGSNRYITIINMNPQMILNLEKNAGNHRRFVSHC
jgi:hypothetical protein